MSGEQERQEALEEVSQKLEEIDAQLQKSLDAIKDGQQQ